MDYPFFFPKSGGHSQVLGLEDQEIFAIGLFIRIVQYHMNWGEGQVNFCSS